MEPLSYPSPTTPWLRPTSYGATGPRAQTTGRGEETRNNSRHVPHANPVPAPTEHVRTAQRKNHEHFRRPHADAVEGRKLPDQFFIGGMAQGLQIQSTGGDFTGDPLYISNFTLTEATLLDL